MGSAQSQSVAGSLGGRRRALPDLPLDLLVEGAKFVREARRVEKEVHILPCSLRSDEDRAQWARDEIECLAEKLDLVPSVLQTLITDGNHSGDCDDALAVLAFTSKEIDLRNCLRFMMGVWFTSEKVQVDQLVQRLWGGHRLVLRLMEDGSNGVVRVRRGAPRSVSLDKLGNWLSLGFPDCTVIDTEWFIRWAVSDSRLIALHDACITSIEPDTTYVPRCVQARLHQQQALHFREWQAPDPREAPDWPEGLEGPEPIQSPPRPQIWLAREQQNVEAPAFSPPWDVGPARPTSNGKMMAGVWPGGSALQSGPSQPPANPIIDRMAAARSTPGYARVMGTIRTGAEAARA